MSFKVNWPEFSPSIVQQAQTSLSKALSSGKKMENLVGPIQCTFLEMGTVAPVLEILEISELSPERFKGIFQLVYDGDAHMTLETHVQANPLVHQTRSALGSHTIVYAHRPLVVPMELKLSNVRLRGIVVLVVDKQKGITIAFKNDPLESIHVNSSFDHVPQIRKMLQSRIENSFRSLFQEELPQMIHQLSLSFLREQEEKQSQRQWSPEQHEQIKWSGNETHEMEEYVLYRSLDGDHDLHGLSKLVEPQKTPVLFENDIPMDRKRNSSGLGLGLYNRTQMSTIFTQQQREALEFPQRTERSLSIDSTPSVLSMQSTLTAPPAMYRKGQLQDTLWRRPGQIAMDRPTMKVPPRRQTTSESFGEEEDTIVKPDNQVSAHLANLLASHHTISPSTLDLTHLAFRTMSITSTTSSQESPKKRMAKRVTATRVKGSRFGIKRPSSRSDTFSETRSIFSL